MRKRIDLDASAIIFSMMQIYSFKSVLSEDLYNKLYFKYFK
ncbi:hypothetical protein M096_4937 [Parabacteroides distasonis str. 3999B T(B) 6]|nr:hypothetical protein M095_3976 [Parabacteroides distasonis str. 3999B T(B) 4]KDS65058.1 hypothetical protein M096_4937 [Parabacteroides distasonis str. 3999B T(B) 6]